MNKIWAFILELFSMPLYNMSAWQVLLATLLSILISYLALKFLKYLWICIKHICRVIKNIFSAKRKCSKIQCKHCGRTLDKCICQANQSRGYLSRLYHYKKENKNK